MFIHWSYALNTTDHQKLNTTREELSRFTVMVLTFPPPCNLNNRCTLSIKLMPIFSFWDPAVLPQETFSRPFGHNRSLHWANHIAPLTRVAPCSLSLLSTLAGQLWSCQGSRSANATQLALGRLRYGVWLMGALSRSAAEKLSSLSLSSFVDKWFWNWRPTEINITGIQKINGTTKIARTWIAPVQFLPTLYRLLDHPISLSQSVREGAAAGEAGCGRRRVTELQWAGCEFPNP